ncbi:MULTISPECIES: hypothetical protein [unclassified Microbacterium]|uniref:hypothetical protein n=1 Tax=unclassified Microbacterium TaxID=2609290 RepID=UPI00301AE80C
MSDLDASADALRRAAEDRIRRARLDEQLAAVVRLGDARRDELAELQARLRVEQADVRRFERMSPSRMWAIVRGDADDRLARERAERDVAERAVANSAHRLEAARDEVARLVTDRDALGDVESHYAFTLAAHERVVRTQGGPGIEELARIARDIGEASDALREIDEALAALGVATEALRDAFEKLESAGGWSTYDTFFGGGFIADAMKHQRIDQASAAFERVNRALERLSIELRDVDAAPVRGVEMSSSLAVFDVVFDNIVSDWMVRDRIARAREESLDLRVRLSELEKSLAERRLSVAEHLAGLAARREALLLPPS